MDAILGMELPLLVKFIVSFAIVLVLIGAAAFLVRKFGGKALLQGVAARGRQPRLAIVDTAPVDSRRSLVIVRRDNVEHLLLIGGPTDVLVEANISMSGAAVQPAREAVADIPTPPLERVVLDRPPVVPSMPVPVVREPEPVIMPEPRADVRPEPVLMPEPRPEPEVRVPPVPAFAPVPPPAPARTEAPPIEVFVEPRVSPANVPPPVTVVPPLPAAATVAPPPEDPLARFAQDLDAHRDHVNGHATPAPPVVSVPPLQSSPAAPVASTAAPPLRSVEPTFSEDQSLADMAQRLEAALRRPLGAAGTRGAPQPPPARHMQAPPPLSASVSARQAEPLRRMPLAATAPHPAPAKAPPMVAPTVVAVPPPTSADRTDAATYENLQREMASLLGRKPGSS
jgi:hypothetical protein